MTLRHTFGQNLVRYRHQAGLTQEQLAEACHVTYETISNIERGRRAPGFDLIEQIATQLSVEPYQLFKSHDAP